MMVKKKILTRKLTRQEAEVGEDVSDTGAWSESKLRERGYIDHLWLFKEIEEDG